MSAVKTPIATAPLMPTMLRPMLMKEIRPPEAAFNEGFDEEAFTRAKAMVEDSTFNSGGQYFQHRVLKELPKLAAGLRRESVLRAIEVLFRLPQVAKNASLVTSTPGSSQSQVYPLAELSDNATQLLETLVAEMTDEATASSKTGKRKAAEENADDDEDDAPAAKVRPFPT